MKRTLTALKKIKITRTVHYKTEIRTLSRTSGQSRNAVDINFFKWNDYFFYRFNGQRLQFSTKNYNNGIRTEKRDLSRLTTYTQLCRESFRLWSWDSGFVRHSVSALQYWDWNTFSEPHNLNDSLTGTDLFSVLIPYYQRELW